MNSTRYLSRQHYLTCFFFNLHLLLSQDHLIFSDVLKNRHTMMEFFSLLLTFQPNHNAAKQSTLPICAVIGWNICLCLVHVIWTERRMTNLVLNVCFDFFSWHENHIWKQYKSLRIISFELMHPYNTLNVPQIVKLSSS